MTIFGIDISHWQRGIDLSKAAQGDTTFVVAKATEGKTFRDPMYATYRAHAESAGLLFAAYHFLRGDSNPAEQAMNVKDVLGNSGVPLIIDWERTDGTPQPTLGTVEAFADCLRALNVTVARLLYLPEWWWQQIGRPRTLPWALWQSAYGVNDGAYPGDSSDRWNHGTRVAAMLQFTSAGRVSGYSGDVDINAYRGTRAELAETGWFIDYRPTPEEPELPSKEELQQWVASTPIVVDAEGNIQTLQRVLRRLLGAQVDPEVIARAVVAALPPDSGDLTSDQVEEAVKQALREGIGA